MSMGLYKTVGAHKLAALPSPCCLPQALLLERPSDSGNIVVVLNPQALEMLQQVGVACVFSHASPDTAPATTLLLTCVARCVLCCGVDVCASGADMYPVVAVV